MSISDNDFISDGIDDWLSDGIDGTIQIKFVKPNERRPSLPSSPCRCDGCRPSTMNSGIRTVRQLLDEYKHKLWASNGLVILRRAVIELHHLDRDGGSLCGPYCVPLDEVRTKAGQIEWIRHLCENEKSWITPTHIMKFIDACEFARARKENA